MSFGRSQTCHRRCLSYIIIYGNYHGTWWDTATPLCVALSHTLSHVLWALYIEAHARPICWIYTYTKLTVSMVTTYPSFFTMEPKDTIPSSYNGNTTSCTNLVNTVDWYCVPCWNISQSEAWLSWEWLADCTWHSGLLGHHCLHQPVRVEGVRGECEECEKCEGVRGECEKCEDVRGECEGGGCKKGVWGVWGVWGWKRGEDDMHIPRLR